MDWTILFNIYLIGLLPAFLIGLMLVAELTGDFLQATAAIVLWPLAVILLVVVGFVRLCRTAWREILA